MLQEEADEDYQIGSLFSDEEEKAGQSSTPNFPSYERKALKSGTGTGILNQFFEQRKDNFKVHKLAEIICCSRSFCLSSFISFSYKKMYCELKILITPFNFDDKHL